MYKSNTVFYLHRLMLFMFRVVGYELLPLYFHYIQLCTCITVVFIICFYTDEQKTFKNLYRNTNNLLFRNSIAQSVKPKNAHTYTGERK